MDVKFNEQMSNKFVELDTKMDSLDLFARDKFKEVEAQLFLHTNDIKGKAKGQDFIDIQMKVIAMKQELEEENVLIQRCFREQKDKMAELIKAFDLAIDRLHVEGDVKNLSKIVGKNLEKGESHIMPKQVDENLQL